MWFYSMLKSEKKLMNENVFPIMLCRFSNDVSALKKCRTNLTSNKKFGYQALNEYSADKLNIFEI